MTFTQRHKLPETLGFHGENEPFRMGIEIWTPSREQQQRHAGILQHRSERLGIERVTVENEVASAPEKSIVAIGEIPSNLFHPSSIRGRANPRDLDSSSFEVNHEKHHVADQTAGG